MALVKFGGGVSEMRGKEGGIIYSRNAYGAYTKQKVTPTNPNTQKQQAQRSLMGNLAQAWRTLTSAQQAAWNNLGDQVTRINVFGDQTTYKGFGLFMRLNRNLTAIGEDAIDDAPSVPEIPVLTLGTLTANVTGTVLTLAFSPTSPGSGLVIAVYATNNILTGRTFVKNFYRLVHYETNPAISPVNIYSDWNSYFGNTLVEGAKIYVQAKLIDDSTGFDGVPDVASTTVINS